MRRPELFCTPLARKFSDVRIRRVPVAHEHFEARLIENAILFALQPIIPPARGLVTPLDCRAWIGIVRERVVPWTEDRFHRSFHVLEKTRDAVAISIEKATDHECGDIVGGISIGRYGRTPPKCAITLLMQIE